MKKISNLLIIDASGSMGSRTAEVREGIREFIQDSIMTIQEGQVDLTTIITEFSSCGRFDTLLNSNLLCDLNPGLADRYHPGGMTALFDAIGLSFKQVPKKQDGVLVTIITDGMENDSRRYSLEHIKALIDKKKNKKNPWIITFIGTSESDLRASALAMGISDGNVLQYSGSRRGVQASIQTGVRMKKAYRKSIQESRPVPLNFFAKRNKVEE